MPKHTKSEQRKNKIKKQKEKKKKKPDKKLIKEGKFDPAHPASTTLLARKQARDMKKRNT